MSQNAVIFDWNGTVLNDAPYMLHATNKTLELFNLPPIDMVTYQEKYTIPLSQSYKSFGCTDEQLKDQHKQVVATFFEHYEEKALTATLREGTEAVLAYLKNMQINTAVLSNYTVPKITEHARHHGIYDLFDDVLANESDGAAPFHKGGKGDWLKVYIAKHDIERGIVVGDTVEEIEIANDLGLVSVAITGGTCSCNRLEEARPHFLIDEMAPLVGIAQQVFA